MVLLRMTTLWKEVLQPTHVILALGLRVIVKEFVNLIKHGQEKYQYAYVSQIMFYHIIQSVHVKTTILYLHEYHYLYI